MDGDIKVAGVCKNPLPHEEQVRMVGRAKRALMHHLKMTEVQAHRYIEKQSMDMRKPKSEIANRILEIYED